MKTENAKPGWAHERNVGIEPRETQSNTATDKLAQLIPKGVDGESVHPMLRSSSRTPRWKKSGISIGRSQRARPKGIKIESMYAILCRGVSKSECKRSKISVHGLIQPIPKEIDAGPLCAKL